MKLSQTTLFQTALLAVVTGGAVVIFTCFHSAPAAACDGPTTRLVSMGPSGTQAGDACGYPSISADGRWVAFASEATNLVACDTNGSGDIFVKDTTTGAIVCASVAPSGSPGEGDSFAASISADGSRVAFASEATNLVNGDGNGLPDVFVRDLAAGTTMRISVSAGGEEGNRASTTPCISADGRFVSFVSAASNLLPNDSNPGTDVFVRELAGALELASVSATGGFADGPSEGGALSGDGRYVAFASMAHDLVAGEPAGGDERMWQVFRRDRQSGTTVRVSINLSGAPGNGPSSAPAISADGRWIAFVSGATDLISSDLDGQLDVFVRDMNGLSIQRVSVGAGGLEPTGESRRPSISADGRFVAFESAATNLVTGFVPPGSTWCYLRDVANASTSFVVAASPEPDVDGGSVSPVISGDGRWIAFSSADPSLVGGDTNALEDVFIHGPLQ